MRESALIVSKTLGMLAREIKPGNDPTLGSTGRKFYSGDHGAEPGFSWFVRLSNTLCVSPNEEVVHGIPNDKPLEEGAFYQWIAEHSKMDFTETTRTPLRWELSLSKPKAIGGYQKIPLHRHSLLSRQPSWRFGTCHSNLYRIFGYGVVRELVGHGFAKPWPNPLKFPITAKEGEKIP